MQASEVISRTRTLIQDDFEPYRYTSAFMMARLSDAIRELALLRPDAFATNTFSATTIADITSESSTVPFDEYFRMPLAYLTAEQVYITESSEIANLRQADSMRQRFQRAMLGTP